ncbi:membrane protease YdiL (CAAX protease family) [Peribacillus deserti]|uniref:Membrane protease YdiL (CAAX protease family) n=1 Tax=Peribacillus deserti TaxID=673318 RepID=A0ABS2QMS7_9BACI|nr:type II CAAX endopeptidase family protein [Peribacillus deserti]MBM7694479.1 membrane protease YdiL (CAAX protease family) [Peribacillus deserti]
MKREYWLVIIVYVAMQLSGLIGVPIIGFIQQSAGLTAERTSLTAGAYWIVVSFMAALIIILLLLRKDMKQNMYAREAAPVSASILWAIGGVFLSLFAQALAGNIERLIGIEAGSDNTQQIIQLIEAVPLVIVVSSIVGPILEEIVFRKIIFGGLYKKFNFIISALISSVIFGLVHGEPAHLLLYSAMGFSFAFLYVRTKRIIVPIVAHVSMNTLVVIVQTVYKDDIEKMMIDAEKAQGFIGGIL